MNGNHILGAIRESIRKIDTIVAKEEYIKSKYNDKAAFIDTEVKNSFSKAQSISSLKYSYGFNHYAARNKVINCGLVSKKYPRCSRRETQYHVVQYNETIELKVEFMIKLKQKLMKTKYSDIMEDKINSMIRDIRRYLMNRVDSLETNQ